MKKQQKQYGLIGFPLGHSFSQRFFTEKFKLEGIDACYSNFEIADVNDVQNILRTIPNLQGFNVTIPHKESIIPLLNAISDQAREIGAVNVVKVERLGQQVSLAGYNSDVVGFVDSLKPLLQGNHRKALVLGTGGASKAVVYGLKELGIETQLVSRKRSSGAITYDDLSEDIIAQYKLIVNCTPLGTYPNVQSYPQIPYHFLGKEHLLYDLVYNPEKTEFLHRGEERGAAIKNGAEMLRLQALEAWRIWNE